MSKKTALVTGANGGIGIAIAEALLADPEIVVYLGIRSGRDRAEKLVAEQGEDRCRLIDLDVCSAENWTSVIESITEATGRIDVLVNCAGFHKDGLLANMSDDDWTSVMQANLDGVFFGCRAVIRPMMSQRFGRIINIASLSALLAPMGQTNYAAAKAGVVAMSQSLAKEVARAGITVNTICPGYIDTDALSDQTPEHRKQLKRSIPMRRFGKAEEVASAVQYFASDQAGYTTSSVLKIDGAIF